LIGTALPACDPHSYGSSGRRRGIPRPSNRFTDFTTPAHLPAGHENTKSTDQPASRSWLFDPARMRQAIFCDQQSGTVCHVYQLKKGLVLDAPQPYSALCVRGIQPLPDAEFLRPARDVGWHGQGSNPGQPARRLGIREAGRAGTRGGKQNVFDDFISLAAWLLQIGTLSQKLAISGALRRPSVAACELAAAATLLGL